MTTNTFDTEESNSNINSPQYFVDDDGSLKFISPVLSSSNFDGSVPVFEGQITASAISPGKFIKNGGEYFPVISVAYDDQELEESPSNEISVTYLDSNSEVQEIIYNLTDDVDVKYENWEEKYLGTQGWSLTYGGNAIFANVGVRGDLEATTLDVGGANGITYDGSTVIIGASVVVNAPIEFNGVTPEELSALLSGYIPSGSAAFDINTSVTTIDGGKITTGSILADKINTNNLFVQNLISFSTTSASRIKILDINDQRHKLQFETGWTREVVPAFIGSSTYVNPNVGFGGSTMGVEIYAGLLNLGVTVSPANIKLLSRSFDSSGLERTINYEADAHQFRSLTNGANSIFSVSGFSIIDINNTANPPAGVQQFGIRMSPLSGFNITGPVTFTGNVNGTFVGNGSGLTNLPAPANVVLTTGTYSNPSWITSLAGSKISGNISGNASNITSYNINQNVGTGNSPTFAGLTVNGSTFIPDAFTAVVSNRVVNVNSSGRLGNPSSSHLIKKNISPLLPPDSKFYDIVPGNKIIEEDISSYRKILDLTPIKFEWDVEDQTPGPEFGLIAEEVVEKMPESSLPGNENVPAYYKITSLFAALLGVVKDQQKTIEDLEARMLQLESQLGG